MGTMQRANRLRLEIEGKARIKILPPRFFPIARAVQDWHTATACFPPAMQKALVDARRPRYSVKVWKRRNGKSQVACKFMPPTTGKLLILDEISTVDPIWFHPPAQREA